ncbi:hypothetical protein FUAX_48120 (plasmid) [Fulvitalea axinellae]|uniref:MarR family transcriptional regulator n=1 Tax=Fulvitalea axinellae TaxID=1182444 RepID=A0AAU9CSX6_9BACT|nr:hypothetical protein FUAX_48120 [Fulvitalea axinellae]
MLKFLLYLVLGGVIYYLYQKDKQNRRYGHTGITEKEVKRPSYTPKKSIPEVLRKKSPEQKILELSEYKKILTIKEIIIKTGLGMEEVETLLRKFVEKGIVQETVNADGKVLYDFS